MAAANPVAVTVPQLGPNFGPALSIIDPSAIAAAIFYLVVLLVIIYTAIASYHWIRYGHRSVMAIPAIAIHIAVSLGLIGFALTGLP
jgi:hypothetical protein